MAKNREADLLSAMTFADLDEQRRLTAELNAIRGERTAARQEDRSIDVQSTVKERLSPVFVHGMSSSESDWLDEVAPNYTTASINSIASKLKAEASQWFTSVNPAVRQDKEEFAEQARGLANRTASQYGTQANKVSGIMLRHIAALYKIAEGTDLAGIPSAADGTTNPDVTDWAAPPMVLPEADADAYTAPPGITPAPEAPSPEGAGLDTESRRITAKYCGECGGDYFDDGKCIDCGAPESEATDEDYGSDNYIGGNSLHDPLQFGLFPGEAEVGKESAYRYLGSPIQQAARHYLGTEEGQTPPIPGEVDEDQDGEAGSSLPYDIGIPPETQDNFVAPAKPKPADSNRAPNVSAHRRTADSLHDPLQFGLFPGEADNYKECKSCGRQLSQGEGGDPPLDENGICDDCNDPYSDSDDDNGYTPLDVDGTTVLKSRHVDASRRKFAWDGKGGSDAPKTGPCATCGADCYLSGTDECPDCVGKSIHDTLHPQCKWTTPGHHHATAAVEASRKTAMSCPNCASSEVSSAGPSGRKMCNQCQTSFTPNAGGGTSDTHIREFAQKEASDGGGWDSSIDSRGTCPQCHSSDSMGADGCHSCGYKLARRQGVATGPNPQGSFVYDAQRAIDQGYKEGFKYAILWSPGRPVPAALTSSAQLGDKYNSQYVTGYKSGVTAGIATLPKGFQTAFGQAAGKAVSIASRKSASDEDDGLGRGLPKYLTDDPSDENWDKYKKTHPQYKGASSKRALVNGDQGQYRECPDCGGKGCDRCGGGGGIPAAIASRKYAEENVHQDGLWPSGQDYWKYFNENEPGRNRIDDEAPISDEQREAWSREVNATRRQAGLPQLELANMDDTVSNPLVLGNTETSSVDGKGAADVANVPTPGKSNADYPQPKGADPVPAVGDGEEPVEDWIGGESVDPEKTAAFRARVQANIRRQVR